MARPETEPSAADDTRRLVRAARNGDGDSFARLYARIAPSLHGWAELRVRPALRPLLDPSDVVQEVWFRAWRAIGELDPDRVPFRRWLFRVAKNVLLEAFRKARSPAFRAGATGLTTRLFVLEGVPDSVTAVSQRLARDEGLSRLVEWVRGLDEGDRALVVHCGLEGLTFAEVGARLQLTRDVVAKRWQRLRERLAGQKLPREILSAVG